MPAREAPSSMAPLPKRSGAPAPPHGRGAALNGQRGVPVGPPQISLFSFTDSVGGCGPVSGRPGGHRVHSADCPRESLLSSRKVAAAAFAVPRGSRLCRPAISLSLSLRSVSSAERPALARHISNIAPFCSDLERVCTRVLPDLPVTGRHLPRGKGGGGWHE